MKTIALKQNSFYNRVAALSLPTISWKLFYLFMLAMFSIVLVFYVFSVNELTQGVYTIKNYNKEINSLLKENKVLSNNFSNNNFLIKTQDRAQELAFEKTKDIKYVQILETSLAKR
jgi:hypothetical protein